MIILDSDKLFAGYQLGCLIRSSEGTNVYQAAGSGADLVFITIHDNEFYEQRGKTIALDEACILDQLDDESFLEVIKSGTVERQGKKYSYFCYAGSACASLREMMDGDPYKEDDAISIVSKILSGLVKISNLTDGGGHYNICPDNILFLAYEAEKKRPVIIGLDHVSKPCNGSPDFITGDIDIRYRAPETFLGRYSSASDVYSVGVMLYEMIHKKLPYPIEETMDAKEALTSIKNAGEPQFDVESERLVPIIKKAMRKNAISRYKNVEEFYNALVNCYGDNESGNDQTEDTKNMNENTHTSGSPKLNVGMTVTQGDGLQAVAGMAELKHRLHRDFVDVIKHRELARKFSIQPPNMLFFGPPGTGKTYLSKRLGEETGMPVCFIKPSDLGSIWIHGSQNLIKELFEKAEEKAKKNKVGCLILIDEFDAFVCKRDGSDNEHMANEVAEWLTQLNDCVSKNIFVIGTTNCIQRIDPAVLRHGRIDQIVYIGLPDKECRQQLFEYELNSRPHEDDIDVEKLADITDGFTSSDISYIVKETATNAFEESVKNEESDIVKISETMLENVIKQTRPSVTKQEIKMFEQQRDEFLQTKNNEHRAIGFYA